MRRLPHMHPIRKKSLLKSSHRCNCNTLRHTATHCYTLQHAATHCEGVYSALALYKKRGPLYGRAFDEGTTGKQRCCSVLQCVAVCCSVLQCVAACCSVLQCVAVPKEGACLHEGASSLLTNCNSGRLHNHYCCSVLQCVAVCCSVLQYVAVCYSALQYLQCVAVPKEGACPHSCSPPHGLRETKRVRNRESEGGGWEG